MKETIKIAGGIILKSAVKWALIVFLGGFVTLITFLIAFFWNIDLMFGESHKFSAFFNGLLNDNIPALILIFGAPIFLIVYFVTAKKMTIRNVIYLLFEGKAGEYVISTLTSAIDKITQRKGWRSELVNKAILKAKVLQAIKEDPQTSRIQRLVIGYGFKKVNLEDVNFQNEDANLGKVLGDRFRHSFAQMVKPSFLFFWMLILFQVILLFCSFF